MNILENIEAVTYEEFIKENNIVPEVLSMAQLQKLLQYKYELEDRQKNYGILYYKPQEYQTKFHNSFKKIRLVLGGNQTGKTECGGAEDINVALGLGNTIEKMGCRPPYKMRVCGNDLDKGIGEILMPKFEKLIPTNCIKKISKYSGGQWKKITFTNYTTLEFMSYEQETKMYEGWTGHYTHFDEPPPHDKYVATIRGLMRFKGKCLITATPLNEPWMYDEIYIPGRNGDKDIDVFEFSLFDNKYLSDEERAFFISQIPKDEKEARVYGRFKHLSGLVYKEFSQEKHCIASFKIPTEWVRICAMDYHPQKKCVILWIAIDPYDRAYVYDELETDGTIKDIAERIAAKEEEEGGIIDYRFIDSISATRDRITGKTPQREFAAEGNRLKHPILFRASTKNFVMGVNAVKEYFKSDKLFFFADKVKLLINSMTRYTWAKANTAESLKERPAKVYDDFPDTLRYGIVLKIKYEQGRNKRTTEEDFNNENDTRSDSVTGYNLAV